METPSEETKDAKRIAIANALQAALKKKMEGENELQAAEENINSDEQINTCLQQLVEQDKIIPSVAEHSKKDIMDTLEGLLKGKKEGRSERDAAQRKIDAAQTEIDNWLGKLTEL